MTSTRKWPRIGNVVAAVWIFGGAVVFFVRFSVVFYRANRSAIRHTLEWVLELLPSHHPPM